MVYSNLSRQWLLLLWAALFRYFSTYTALRSFSVLLSTTQTKWSLGSTFGFTPVFALQSPRRSTPFALSYRSRIDRAMDCRGEAQTRQMQTDFHHSIIEGETNSGFYVYRTSPVTKELNELDMFRYLLRLNWTKMRRTAWKSMSYLALPGWRRSYLPSTPKILPTNANLKHEWSIITTPFGKIW